MNYRKLGLITSLAAILIMSACGTGGQEKVNVKTPEQVAGTETPTNTNGTTETTPGEDPQTTPDSNAGEDQEVVNSDVFRNITITGDKGEYVVKGEASVHEGVFYYTVEDGHEYQVEETKVSVEKGAPAWGPFELNISIPEDMLPLNGTLTLELFERSAKDNSAINQYYTKLDEFGY
ncbi:Gmad2 immunoglobulin-like domain-containing protein [Schinkia sp. CFF1]